MAELNSTEGSEYILLREAPDLLEVLVTEKLRQGWILWGTPFVLSGYIIAQAMVKYDPLVLANIGPRQQVVNPPQPN